jgi:hypothetical protein
MSEKILYNGCIKVTTRYLHSGIKFAISSIDGIEKVPITDSWIEYKAKNKGNEPDLKTSFLIITAIAFTGFLSAAMVNFVSDHIFGMMSLIQDFIRWTIYILTLILIFAGIKDRWFPDPIEINHHITIWIIYIYVHGVKHEVCRTESHEDTDDIIYAIETAMNHHH